MGYQSFNDISILQFRGDKQKAAQDFKALLESVEEDGFEYAADKDGDDTIASFEDNHSTMIKHIIEESKKYPGLLLEINFDATNEDSDDQRCIRILEGESETVQASITFEPFGIILTDEEKESMQTCLNSAELRGMVSTVDKTEDSLRLSIVTNFLINRPDGTSEVKSTWHRVAIPKELVKDDETILRGSIIQIKGHLFSEVLTGRDGFDYPAPYVLATHFRLLGTGDDTLRPEQEAKA